MEIEVKDLKKGDEILIGTAKGLAYCIVLKDPVYDNTLNKYKNIKLSANLDKKMVTRYYNTWNYPPGNYSISNATRVVKSYPYTEIFYNLTPKDHNKTQYKDLNNKKLWLIARKEEAWI